MNVKSLQVFAPNCKEWTHKNVNSFLTHQKISSCRNSSYNQSTPNHVLYTHSTYGSINRGFTLVEIMVVVVILAIFAGMIGVSVGKSDTQKNRAYYEHLQSSLSYIRLISAERMQPMGIRLATNEDGQSVPEVVKLDNAYSAYQKTIELTDTPKNNMELSANIGSGQSEDVKQPTWTIEDDIELPTMPNNLVVSITSLERASKGDLQPWFQGQQVPQVVWFGTGQSTPVSIEVRYNDRLVGNAIQVMPDGRLKVEK